MAAAMDTAGRIEPGVTYRLDSFKKAAGWSNHALRTARRKGLRVIYAGGRAFVRGDDFLSYLDQISREAVKVDA